MLVALSGSDEAPWQATSAAGASDRGAPPPFFGWGSHPPPSPSTLPGFVRRVWYAVAPASSQFIHTRRDSGSSDDDRNRSAVGAPGRAGDIRGEIGAEKGDHRGDLLGLGEPAERPPFSDGLEHLLAGLPNAPRLLVGETALPEPRLGRSRTRRERVAADPARRVQVGHQS